MPGLFVPGWIVMVALEAAIASPMIKIRFGSDLLCLNMRTKMESRGFLSCKNMKINFASNQIASMIKTLMWWERNAIMDATNCGALKTLNGVFLEVLGFL